MLRFPAWDPEVDKTWVALDVLWSWWCGTGGGCACMQQWFRAGLAWLEGQNGLEARCWCLAGSFGGYFGPRQRVWGLLPPMWAAVAQRDGDCPCRGQGTPGSCGAACRRPARSPARGLQEHRGSPRQAPGGWGRSVGAPKILFCVLLIVVIKFVPLPSR